MKIQTRPFRETLSATGTLRAREAVALTVERAGVVRQIHFLEGKPVKAGDVLIALDDSELQAQLKRARAQLDLAVATEKRDRDLFESSKLISPAEYDQSRANLAVARSETELIEAQLQKTRLIAPFDGIAGLRHVSIGTYLTAGTLVTTLQDVTVLKLDFTLPERYHLVLQSAKHVMFRVTGQVEPMRATIYAIEPSVDVATRSIQVRAEAANPGGGLLPGAFAEVQVELAEIGDAILIPAIALIPGLKEQQVYVHRNGQVQPRVVQVGLRTADAVQITSGLQPGEEVVLTGVLQLRPDMKVQVRAPAAVKQPIERTAL